MATRRTVPMAAPGQEGKVKYLVKVGINYKPDGSTTEVRREPGEIIDDLPKRADISSLIQQGTIEPAAEPEG